jgi:hypothetical protein
MKQLEIKRNRRGEIIEPKSAYNPSKEVQELTARIARDYQLGYTNWNKPLNEFNGRSVIEEINANQKSFNSYIPPKSEDPDESWRAQTVRPIVRNKLISIAAHVTASIIFPEVFAQTDTDEEDRMAAQIMRDLIAHVIETSNYSRAFVVAVISALVDPAVVVNQGYQEVMRTVKRMKDDGTYSKEEIIDEALSGFYTQVIPLSEFYIANLYEADVQKQRFVIRQRYLDYYDAEAIYGGHENFKYVKAGAQVVFDAQTETFYEVVDDENPNLVHEVTYYCRSKDLELTFIGGVIMCDSEYPIQREDKLYPFAMSGYEPINNGLFALYKSAANKLGPDEDLINTLYNMVMDGTFLALMPPMALYGDEEVNSSVIVPGGITSLHEDSKLEAIGPKSDLRAGLLAIEETEKSMAETSSDNLRSGISTGGERTAYEVQQLQENAQKILGLFGKYIGFLVKDIGTLMVGDILQYMTVPDLKKFTSLSDPLAYKTILLPDQVMGGKKVTKKIQFTEDASGDKEDIYESGMKILKEEGGLKSNLRLYKVNPQIFRQMKYRIKISPDALSQQSKALERALNLELYDRAIANPYIDHQKLTQDFLFETYKPGQSDKYMKTQEKMQEELGQQLPQAPGQGNKPDMNMVGQLTGSNSLKNALSLNQ